MRTATLRRAAAAALSLPLLAALGCGSAPRLDLPVTDRGTLVPALSDAPAAAPPVAQGLTADDLARARARPEDWLTYYGAYDGQRYSPLDQINTGNVAQLRPAWTFQYGIVGLVPTPATYSFEAAPLVVDGVMFVSGWDGHVWALDAVTGEVLWHYQHAIPLDTPLCCGNVNRGVAVSSPSTP